MIAITEYSFNNGLDIINARWPQEWNEVHEVIEAVDLSEMRTKISCENTILGKVLYSSIGLNVAFREQFRLRGWLKRRIQMVTTVDLSSVPAEIAQRYRTQHRGYREISFVKEGLVVEAKFGEYASKVYSGLAKMTIFHKRDIIDAGIEIVPMRRLASEMSTGVSYFEQMKADLETRGVADLDIPVVVLGIDG